MKFNYWCLLTILFLLVLIFYSCCTLQNVTLSEAEISFIGQKIFMNECGGKEENLIVWNEGEDFVSLGIGHFIWYPQGKKGPFRETFPELLKFLKKRGAEPPEWLNKTSNLSCPWKNREEFMNNQNSQKIISLRKFLSDTISLQAIFLANRLLMALPEMLKSTSEESFHNVQKQFYRVALTPGGMYALVDYVNFKGEGIDKSESYARKGWGLLQVLEEMHGEEDGPEALREFCRAANFILKRRVINSPPERNEQKWLAGWEKRIASYCIENQIFSEDLSK